MRELTSDDPLGGFPPRDLAGTGGSVDLTAVPAGKVSADAIANFTLGYVAIAANATLQVGKRYRVGVAELVLGLPPIAAERSGLGSALPGDAIEVWALQATVVEPSEGDAIVGEGAIAAGETVTFVASVEGWLVKKSRGGGLQVAIAAPGYYVATLEDKRPIQLEDGSIVVLRSPGPPWYLENGQPFVLEDGSHGYGGIHFLFR